jgi:hypothetical protein
MRAEAPLSTEQRRVLALLLNASRGLTDDTLMRIYGFTSDLLTGPGAMVVPEANQIKAEQLAKAAVARDEQVDVVLALTAPCKGFSGPCRDHCTWAPERSVPAKTVERVGERSPRRWRIITA